MKIYYKVVSYRLKSRIYYLLPKEFVVQYKVGKWVYPKIKGTKLMVFNSLRNAYNFCFDINYIYTCLVKNPSYSGVFVPHVGNLHFPSQFLEKWFSLQKKQKQHKKFFKRKAVPKGTVFVDGIKLLEPVDKSLQLTELNN